MADALPRPSTRVDEELVARVLAPYKPGCRYLLDADVDLPEGDETFVVRGRARFAIEESCYIDDTGHLNSVEVNIAYNQLLYVLMATGGPVLRAIPALADLSLDEFCRRHLPDVLIHDLSIAFKRPIDRRTFEGELVFEQAHVSRRFLALRSTCRFHDEGGGLARGTVKVAFVDSNSVDSNSVDANSVDANPVDANRGDDA